MKLALPFLLLGAACLAWAWRLGGVAWLLAWPACSFLLAGAAYLGLGPRVFGKRATGSLAPWALPLTGPFLAFTWGVFALHGLLVRRPAWQEVAPGLYLGRRVPAMRLPPRVTTVVDLTAEFPACRGLPPGVAYICLPTLDRRPSEPAAFRALLERLAEAPGPIYLHCAQGHGRSAALAAALLIRRGLAPDVRAAEAMLRRVRPGVRLSEGQRALVARATASAYTPGR